MSTKESKTAVRRNQERLKTVMPAMSWRGGGPAPVHRVVMWKQWMPPVLCG